MEIPQIASFISVGCAVEPVVLRSGLQMLENYGSEEGKCPPNVDKISKGLRFS